MWLLLSSLIVAAEARESMKCKHGFAGHTEMTWHSTERLTAEELERARRAGRAVSPVPQHGALTVAVHRRPAVHARGENFHWVIVVDDEEVSRRVATPTDPRPPSLKGVSRAWRTDNVLEIPPGLPDVFEVHLVDQLLGDSCAVRVVRSRDTIKRVRPLD